MNIEDYPETIEYSSWWKNGGMLINRDCLPPTHPEHTYNYVKNTLGVDPEVYGIPYPFHRYNEKVIHMNLKRKGINLTLDQLRVILDTIEEVKDSYENDEIMDDDSWGY